MYTGHYNILSMYVYMYVFHHFTTGALGDDCVYELKANDGTR